MPTRFTQSFVSGGDLTADDTTFDQSQDGDDEDEMYKCYYQY